MHLVPFEAMQLVAAARAKSLRELRRCRLAGKLFNATDTGHRSKLIARPPDCKLAFSHLEWPVSKHPHQIAILIWTCFLRVDNFRGYAVEAGLALNPGDSAHATPQ